MSEIALRIIIEVTNLKKKDYLISFAQKYINLQV